MPRPLSAFKTAINFLLFKFLKDFLVSLGMSSFSFSLLTCLMVCATYILILLASNVGKSLITLSIDTTISSLGIDFHSFFRIKCLLKYPDKSITILFKFICYYYGFDNFLFFHMYAFYGSKMTHITVRNEIV